MIKLTTNKGVIRIELDYEKAPKTAANFESYVKSGHYDNTIFHRVIAGFMIQGGGMTADMQQKPCQAAIQNEADNGLKNDTYSIAMARTSDPHSATAQFFINVANNNFLDFKSANSSGYGYCVFGKVIDGKEVVDLIEKIKTGNRNMHQDVPNEDVIIEKAEII